MLLRRSPPPVPVARLVGVDRPRLTLRFEAVAGEPLGPKFPVSITDGDVETLITLGRRMAQYHPRAPFGRRFDPGRRLALARTHGLIDTTTADALAFKFRRDRPRFVFAHGDITARNVLRGECAVLIDWEWSGWYPRGWDLAFSWFSFIDVPSARAAIEAAVDQQDRRWFWRSALLIQLLHLCLPGLGPASPFRANHERGLGELLTRVMAPGG
jgi:hypothetical protein